MPDLAIEEEPCPVEDLSTVSTDVVNTVIAPLTVLFGEVTINNHNTTTTYTEITLSPGQRQIDMILEEWEVQQVEDVFNDAFHLYPTNPEAALRYALDNAKVTLGRIPSRDELEDCIKHSQTLSGYRDILVKLLDEGETWGAWNAGFAESPYDAPEHTLTYRDNARYPLRALKRPEVKEAYGKGVFGRIGQWFRGLLTR